MLATIFRDNNGPVMGGRASGEVARQSCMWENQPAEHDSNGITPLNMSLTGYVRVSVCI